MPDLAAALLLALACAGVFLLFRIAAAAAATRQTVARVESDLAALKSDLADLSSWKPERLCRFDRGK